MLNRLLGIIYILLNKKTVTAKELAERFEVSIRTIYRDVENLSMAGIPIYTRKGKNGGIALTDQFVLNKMLVTEEEQKQILSALASLKETGAAEESETMRKLGDFFRTEPVNWVSIDFSDWSGKRQELFEQVKRAILSHTVLSFDYYGQYGDMSRRVVEPAQLLFKDYTWYLRAFCREKEDWRLFKLLRMKRVKTTDEVFTQGKESTFRQRQSSIPDEKCDKIKCSEAKCSRAKYDEIKAAPHLMKITLLIDKSEAFLVYDRFQEEEITVLENGDFLVCVEYLVDEWVYGMILSFGARAKVLEPAEIKNEVLRRIEQMRRRYEDAER